MNLVTWTDADGGHHVGEIQRDPNERMVLSNDRDGRVICQVRESCDGILSWPAIDDLKPYLTRSERGEE